MTDLEMTRLCAEAMGIATEESHGVLAAYYREGEGLIQEIYDPLHDDAQAMALVKRFELTLTLGKSGQGSPRHGSRTGWRACPYKGMDGAPRDMDLNRAICLCVAKMQAAK